MFLKKQTNQQTKKNKPKKQTPQIRDLFCLEYPFLKVKILSFLFSKFSFCYLVNCNDLLIKRKEKMSSF